MKAHSNVKMASWDCFVLVFDSSGETASRHGNVGVCFQVDPEVNSRMSVQHLVTRCPAP